MVHGVVEFGIGITLSVDFVSTERKVFLRGEAYFQVAKDTTKPFRVVVNDMMVEALGTGFNINAFRMTIVCVLLW